MNLVLRPPQVPGLSRQACHPHRGAGLDAPCTENLLARWQATLTAGSQVFRRSSHPARLIEAVVGRVCTVVRMRPNVGTLLSALLSPQPWSTGAGARRRRASASIAPALVGEWRSERSSRPQLVASCSVERTAPKAYR